MYMRILTAFFAFLFLLTACQKPVETPTETLVQVGDSTITQKDIDQRLSLMSEADKEFASTPIGKQNLLQIITREKLIRTAARDSGIDQSDIYLSLLEDKRLQLKEIYDQYAEQLLEIMWYDKLREDGTLAVTDEEIDAYYKKYPYEMTVKQIIVADAQTADEVLRSLKNSPSRWKTLARQYSVAPEQIREDSFSFMPGEFIPEIEVIAANSSAGTVQGFIKTAQGFHIIMKTGEKRLSKKDASPRIREVLENKKLDDALNTLKNKYEVVIYEKTE